MNSSLVRSTRQNHSIEHATVSVLLERGARTPLGGNSTPWGFFVYGKLTTEEVVSAASEAIHRLWAGDEDMAVSPYCGTNLVAGALLAGILTGLIVRRTQSPLRRVPLTAAAIVSAKLLGRPLGKILQRRFTTLADVRGMQISRVGRLLKLGDFAVHSVSTGRTPV